MQRRSLVLIPALAILAGCAFQRIDRPPVARELAPGGTVRIGVAVAAAPSTTAATRDVLGRFHGPAAEIARSFADSVDLPYELVAKRDAAQLAADLASGELNAAVLPADAPPPAGLATGPALPVPDGAVVVAVRADQPAATAAAQGFRERVRRAGLGDRLLRMIGLEVEPKR